MPERSIRFGVTDHAGRRAATWKCWTQVGSGKKDVYLACRALQGNVKLSLHESGRWHLGFDATRFSSMFEKESTPASRFAGIWGKPAPLFQGLTLACRVHTPWYAVTIPVTRLDENVFWIQAVPPGQSIEVVIFLSDAGALSTDWPGRRSMNTSLVGSLELDGGGSICVVYHAIPWVEPNLPAPSAHRYFQGAGEQDLCKEGTRAVIWGDCEDGSVYFYEAPVSVKKRGTHD
jgi:hypothetical protein